MTTENSMPPPPQRSPQHSAALNPYDTGETLEPHPWIHPGIGRNPDTRAAYGKVDYDTDDGTTLATIHITRNPDSNSTPYTITIAGNTDDFTVTFTH